MPHPDSPTIANVLPGSTIKLIPCNTRAFGLEGYWNLTSLNWTLPLIVCILNVILVNYDNFNIFYGFTGLDPEVDRGSISDCLQIS